MNSDSRLDRIEALVESNARSIQAMGEQFATEREETRTERAELRRAIVRTEEAITRLTTLNEGVANLLGSLDSDRPTILSKLNRIENKVDRLLPGKDSNREAER